MPMSDKAANTLIQALIGQIRERAEEAAIVAKAADKLAKRGQTDKASTLLMDVEGPTFEVQEIFRTVISIRQRVLSNPHRSSRRAD